MFIVYKTGPNGLGCGGGYGKSLKINAAPFLALGGAEFPTNMVTRLSVPYFAFWPGG